MVARERPILIELHQRIRTALRSTDATEAPSALRRLLWNGAGMLNRLLGGRQWSPQAEDIQQVIDYATRTLDAWTTWLGSPARQPAHAR
jgi:hypothetical protein